MQEYKIISSDLDGTLLDRSMNVSKENRAAIEKLSKLGVHFVPNSGRALREIPEEVKNLPGTRYIIYSDGTVIYDKITGEKNALYMSREDADEAYRILCEYDTMPLLHASGNSYAAAEKFNEEAFCHYQVSPVFGNFLRETNLPRKDFRELVHTSNEIELFYTPFHDDREMEECKKRLQETGRYLIVSSIPHSIEVLSIHGGKGQALLRLADMLGVDRRATIAVGDSTNDMAMIVDAGLGLAMSNACEELKEAADGIACSNEEHVARYLLENYIEKGTRG